MNPTQRSDWAEALRAHLNEVERLTQALQELEAVAREPTSASTYMRNVLRRQVEFTSAQRVRHQIDVALLSSLLASSNELH